MDRTGPNAMATQTTITTHDLHGQSYLGGDERLEAVEYDRYDFDAPKRYYRYKRVPEVEFWTFHDAQSFADWYDAHIKGTAFDEWYTTTTHDVKVAGVTSVPDTHQYVETVDSDDSPCVVYQMADCPALQFDARADAVRFVKWYGALVVPSEHHEQVKQGLMDTPADAPGDDVDTTADSRSASSSETIVSDD